MDRAGLTERLAGSGRVRALRMLWGAGKGWAAAVALLVVANAVLPNASLVALGYAAGRIPAAAAAHLHGAAGRALAGALLAAGLLYAATLLTGPYQEWLSACVKARLVDDLQSRLMAAVSGPVGVAHLEDPEIRDRLELARGTLTGHVPADAPVALAAAAGSRLAGIGACAVLATFRWWLGLALLAVWLLIRRPLRKIILAQIVGFRTRAEVLRRAWYFLYLAIRPTAAKELRVFGLGDWTVDRYREHWAAGMATTRESYDRLARRAYLLAGAVLAAYLVACGTLAYAALHHQIGLRELSVMLPLLPATMYAGTVTTSDISAEWMVSALPDQAALEARLRAAREELDGGRDPAGLPEHGIRLDGVRFAYPGGDPVLDGLDLEIPAGRSTAIVGANGAGKTTLVKLLARMHDPTGGTIAVDGVPLRDLDAARWQRRFAAVYQDFDRYPLSLAENVALGAVEHLDDAAGRDRAAARAGALDLAAEVGWDTVLSRRYEGGTDLSGGQWQRVALARALFAVEHGATVLVLDEPTAWLDVRAEAAFYDRFLDLTRGLTSIVISHRFSTVRRADRICVLDGGRLAEQGTHDELMALDGIYAEMFRLQAARFRDDGDDLAEGAEGEEA
ncbi:ABC transporter ATP-binding protein [Actinomadura nitritigenes]|uniref:ABC transporter ATP-binding protein n=1 Tax=Actinomadura nitritigenes TaxID=134602 RepID=UPI0036814509